MLALLHEAVNSARWVLRGHHDRHVDHLHYNSRIDAVINLVVLLSETRQIVWQLQCCRKVYLMLAHCVRRSHANCA